MKVLATFNKDEQLEVRALETRELRAINAVHSFKQTAENELRRLEQIAAGCSQATAAYLNAAVKRYELETEKIVFNWDDLTFVERDK